MFPQENSLLSSLNVSSIKIPRFSLNGWNVSDCRNQNTLLKSFRESSGSLLPDVRVNACMYVGIYVLPHSGQLSSWIDFGIGSEQSVAVISLWRM